LKTIFIPHSFKATRNNPTSPHDGNETVQNSKSKSKKFSFLCTFKKVSVDGSFGAEINISFQLYLQGLPHTCLHCPSASLGLVYHPPPFHSRSVLIKGTVREYRKTRNTYRASKVQQFISHSNIICIYGKRCFVLIFTSV
jgi:hypothetical protein